MLIVERITDTTQFEAVAGSFILQRESENFLMLGLMHEFTLGRREGAGEPTLYVIRDESGQINGVALWAGYGLILTRATPGTHAALADYLETHDIRYPMICGPAPATAAFAIAMLNRSGRPHAPGPVMRAMEAKRVVPPNIPPSGSLRLATLADLPLSIEWSEAFSRKLNMRAAGSPERVRWRLEHGCQYFWCDPEPVSMACAIGPTKTGIRIGLVYTPPNLRRRGYASACVAEVTKRLLETGRSSVFLYAEANNHTSNHVYESIGYEFIGEWQEFDLHP